MRVRTTQIIDYWIGVPLCFLLSIGRRIFSLLPGRSAPVSPPRTILFIELSEMGSAVLAHSALVECQRQFPQARICFLIFTRNRESVEVLGTLDQDNIVTISDQSLLHFVLDSFRFIAWAWRERLDTVIDLELFSRATMILSFFSGARRRTGFYKGTSEGLYRGDLLTIPVAYNSHQHMPLNFLALVRALSSSAGVQAEYLKENLQDLVKPLPVFLPSPEEDLAVRQCLAELLPSFSHETHLIVINPDPGEALPLRGWPIERYREVMIQISSLDPDVIFVVLGLARSHHYYRALAEGFPSGRVLDFTGRTSTLREVLTLFGLARLLLTGDSGPAHFAALTRIQSVVLFGPETPVLYRPLGDRSICLSAQLACSPCLSAFNHRYTRCTDNQCMQQIGSEMVSIQVRKGLAESIKS